MAVISQQAALQALYHFLTSRQIITDPVALITYLSDAGLDKGYPLGVVFPHSSDDVERIARWANEYSIPLVARGAGTGLSGGAVAEHGGLIVEFARMEDIGIFDERSGSIIVQPGTITLSLETLVKERGWYYPPDPSSGRASTLGGNIAENSGGPHCFKYGVTTNYVMELELVLADGRCLRVGGRALDYPEFDLSGLLTGSEGTLGLLTEARLRLIRQPPAYKTLISAFASIEAAGAAVSDIIARGLVPATMEMMDQSFLRIIEDFTHAGFPTNAGAALIIEVDGYPQSIEPQMEEIIAILREHHAFDLRVAQTEEERANIWYGRKSAAGAIARLAPMYYLVDGTVPRSKLAAALTEINRICTEDYNLRVIYVFHAGDGNLHPLILIDDPKDKELVARIIEAGGKIMRLCLEYDGSITGEHGVGIEKRAYMPLMYSLEELQAMLDIKDIFDPRHLLNPAKIFPSDTPAPAPLPAPPSAPASPCAPTSTQEAAEALRAWLAAGQQIRIVGGGTKSRALPPGDVQISSSGMNGIVTFAREDLYVTVGAGTPLHEVQAELAPYNMDVPLVSPWEEATLGGIVATNFNGPLRRRYGGVRDLLLSVTAVLPNGRVIRAGRPVVKNVAGYDLARLLVGSHGTLGLLTELTLKLAPRPRARASLIIPVTHDSPAAALRHALDQGAHLARLCLVSSALLLCRGSDVAAFAPQAPAAPYALVYTVEGLPEDTTAELEQVVEVLSAAGLTDTYQIDDLAGSDIWGEVVRDNSADATLVRMGVAFSDLPDIMLGHDALLNNAPFVADISNSLLYVFPGDDVAAHLSRLREAARQHNGYACTPLHAGASDFDSWGHQPASLDLMRAIKQRWDSAGLLNPGAFVV